MQLISELGATACPLNMRTLDRNFNRSMAVGGLFLIDQFRSDAFREGFQHERADSARSGAPGRRRRSRPRRTPKGRQVDPQALDEVRALLGDRPRRRDLLIEHLHLIQDDYGHLSARASRGARRRDEACADRGLRGRDLLRAFRRGEGRRDAAARRSRCGSATRSPARWRAPSICSQNLPSTLGPDVRVVRAPCMGACDRAPVCAVGHVQVMQATTDSVGRRASRSRRACARLHAPAHDFDALSRGRRLCAARKPASPASARATTSSRSSSDAGLRGLGGAGFPDRPQVVAGARRAGAAADGGQRRRGRARHLQGPLLSRTRSAPLHRRHADRRLGGRGGRHLHLHARRISRAAADAGRRDRQGRARRACASTPGSICAAAPAPTSAAKNPR